MITPAKIPVVYMDETTFKTQEVETIVFKL